MSREQKRGNRETKKPKQVKVAAKPETSVVMPNGLSVNKTMPRPKAKS